jgi:hypothetical protein
VKRLRLTILGISLILGMATAHGDVVAVVSSRSTVVSLSKNQLVDIFLGRAARFPNGDQAVPIDQAEGAAAHRVLHPFRRQDGDTNQGALVEDHLHGQRTAAAGCVEQ